MQVVIDLFCLGSAGRAAATKLYEMMRSEQKKQLEIKWSKGTRVIIIIENS